MHMTQENDNFTKIDLTGAYDSGNADKEHK